MRRLPLALLLLTALAGAPSYRAGSPAPYRIAVDVAFGEPLGPELLRDELERELVARLRSAECFERTEPGGDSPPEGTDLVVEVILDRYREESRYDVSLAQHHDPDAEPGADKGYVVQVDTVVYLQVRRAEDRAVVRMKRQRQQVSRRPVLDEDPRFEANLDLIDRIVHRTREFLCDTSPQKWEKLIAKATPAR